MHLICLNYDCEIANYVAIRQKPMAIETFLFHRYILDLNKHQIDGFTSHVSSIATATGFEPVQITNNEAYARFRFKSAESQQAAESPQQQ